MAMALLGETLDLHCGGVDLIFPHHEDEIAQSEGATGKTFARVWCHGEFLLTDGAKMAKRVGNVSTVRELREQGISPAALRHLMYSTHYRQQLNLSSDQLEASMRATLRVAELWGRLGDSPGGGTPELEAAAATLESGVREALFDDLNAPRAVAALFDFLRSANAELDREGADAGAVDRARGALQGVNAVLDLLPLPAAALADGAKGDTGDGIMRSVTGALVAPDLVEWVEDRIAARQAARDRRDFTAADALRKEIEERGVELKDTSAGARWRVVKDAASGSPG